MTAPQLDLFADHDAVDAREDRRRAKLAADAAHQAATEGVHCCTGDPIAPTLGHGGTQYPKVVCGRCGEVVPRFALQCTHDLGWIGCPVDRPDGAFRHIDFPALGTRHDEQHHAACECGHAWGIHGRWWEAPEGESCMAWCGCKGYRPAVVA